MKKIIILILLSLVLNGCSYIIDQDVNVTKLPCDIKIITKIRKFNQPRFAPLEYIYESEKNVCYDEVESVKKSEYEKAKEMLNQLP